MAIKGSLLASKRRALGRERVTVGDAQAIHCHAVEVAHRTSIAEGKIIICIVPAVPIVPIARWKIMRWRQMSLVAIRVHVLARVHCHCCKSLL